MAIIGTDIQKAMALLCDQQVVAIPTETVYGLAGNGFSEKAVAQIFAVKNRPFFDPLILHIGNLKMLEQIASTLPPLALQLAQQFWPGPLTLVLPKTANVPNLVTAGSDWVAVRMPKHPLALALLQNLSFPVAAPSANPFGYISPTSAQHVANQLGDKIPYILDGGSSEVGVESTIVQIIEDKIRVLRLGGLSIEDLQQCLGKEITDITLSASNPKAPGMLSSHYAPTKPLYMLQNNQSWEEALQQMPPNTAILAFNELPTNLQESYPHLILSKNACLNQAAANLFAALRTLEALNVSCILAQYVPETGLGRAINDRLRRASFR